MSIENRVSKHCHKQRQWEFLVLTIAITRPLIAITRPLMWYELSQRHRIWVGVAEEGKKADQSQNISLRSFIFEKWEDFQKLRKHFARPYCFVVIPDTIQWKYIVTSMLVERDLHKGVKGTYNCRYNLCFGTEEAKTKQKQKRVRKP